MVVDITGKRVVLVGRFKGIRRAEAVAKLEALGVRRAEHLPLAPASTAARPTPSTTERAGFAGSRRSPCTDVSRKRPHALPKRSGRMGSGGLNARRRTR